MPPRFRRLAVPLLAAALLTAGTALARAAADELGAVESLGVSLPALLGPINSAGRNGWNCAPEKTARTTRAREAELPEDPGL